MHLILIQLHYGIHNATVIINATGTKSADCAQPRCFVYRPPVRPIVPYFVRPSVTRVDQSKTVGEDYAIFTVQ